MDKPKLAVELKMFDDSSYFVSFEKTSWFCAHCGKQEVWDESGAGDYYTGTESVCVSCGYTCSYLGGPTISTGERQHSVLRQLRKGIASL